MSHPIFWPTRSFFYPVGNTPPICLTDQLPPEQQADVLLLGCGDLRNILYTVHADGVSGTKERRFDFTCCDIEPAVLARNILLLTLLADGEAKVTNAVMWAIYYDFLIDSTARSVIASQSAKLAELSSSCDEWNACGYAPFIRVCTRNTLTSLHRLWTQYAEMNSWSNARQKTFKKKFVDVMRQIGKENPSVTTGMRCAGPLAFRSVDVVAEAYRTFWKTGATVELSIAAANVNPTFAFATSGEGCVAHYGTCPLYAFHLTPAFAELEGSRRKPAPTLSDVYSVVREQFRTWCDAFRRSLQSNCVVVRAVLGDVLAVCHTLHQLASTGMPTAQHTVMAWQASTLVLDGGDHVDTRSAPLSFHVVDSSNLADHIGMLNILVAASPLLVRSPFTSLRTETLLPLEEAPAASLSRRLCADIVTISILLDLSPLALISGFSSSEIHEPLSKLLISDTQFHQRLIWKIPSCIGAPTTPNASTFMDSKELAELLMAAYLQMFSYENLAGVFQGFSLQTARENSSVHYCRQSFALLVQRVMSIVECDQEATVEALLCLISQDISLPVGRNYYQDLACQFHLMGVHSTAYLRPGISQLKGIYAADRFRTWSRIPPVVCIIFSIPRHKLNCLDAPDVAHCATPILHTSVATGMQMNTFCSMRIAFGTTSCTGHGEDIHVKIHEDPAGKRGTSPAIVTFWVPTWLLALAPQHTRVALHVLSTPAHTVAFARKLGLMLEIHSADLNDTESVHVVSVPTSVCGRQIKSNMAAALPQYGHTSGRQFSTEQKTQLQPSSDGRSLERISSRQTFVGTDKIRIQNPATKVIVEQTGSCAARVEMELGGSSLRLFPFPILGRNAKLRVARKSGWVEVVAPISRGGHLFPSRFPVQNALAKGVFAPWNIHRINLEQMPPLSLSRPGECNWLQDHLSSMFSARQLHSVTVDADPLIQVKQAILCILRGVLADGKRVFGLQQKSGGDIGTVIFVLKIRLDLASETIVADGYVLPMTEKLVDNLHVHLGRMLPQIPRAACTDDELVEWARLLPALAERCRDWPHRDDCAYLREGSIPFSSTHGENPICDCGRGKVSQEFLKQPGWAPFAPYVTRIAISPLFDVSCLDPMANNVGEAPRDVEETKSKTGSQQASPRCSHCRKTTSAGPILVCSQCKEGTYCDQDCQKADWKKHKVCCRKKKTA